MSVTSWQTCGSVGKIPGMGFTERLKTLAAQHRLNPKRVSEALEMSYSTVERWFKGETQPRLDQAAALADLFGVSLDSLAGREFGPALSEDDLSILDAARTVGAREAKRRLLLAPDVSVEQGPIQPVSRSARRRSSGE